MRAGAMRIGQIQQLCVSSCAERKEGRSDIEWGERRRKGLRKSFVCNDTFQLTTSST
jgi:hypothetical protein